MSATVRPLVLDANILVRAALGPRARGIVERHAADAGFFVPACCVDEGPRTAIFSGSAWRLGRAPESNAASRHRRHDPSAGGGVRGVGSGL